METARSWTPELAVDKPDVMATPRYRTSAGPALLSAGFRPFFLLSALWACLAIPLWLSAYGG